MSTESPDPTVRSVLKNRSHKRATARSTMFKTPDITVAQIVGFVPVIANALYAFGVFHLSSGQQDSLEKTLYAAGALFFADGIIRHGRATGNSQR